MKRYLNTWQVWVMVLYIVVVLYLTLFCRERLELTESYIIIPRNKYYLVSIGWMPAVWEVVDNILLFIPLGILLPMVCVHISWKKVAIIAIATSASIEVCQLVFRLGLFELNDILHNTLGAVVGYSIYLLFTKIKMNFK